MRRGPKILSSTIVVAMLAGCSSARGPAPVDQAYIVFFDEFSANLSGEARSVIDSAATEAKRRHTTRIRVEARANATGSPDATMKISQTRAAVVRDALLSDGIAASSISLVPLGQAGTTDTGVTPRRTTITLEN